MHIVTHPDPGGCREPRTTTTDWHTGSQAELAQLCVLLWPGVTLTAISLSALCKSFWADFSSNLAWSSSE